jgi:hypothetical protein
MEDVAKYFMPAALITLLVIRGGVPLWRYFKDSKNESKCPNCDKFWAAEYLDEKLVGIFQKAHAQPRHVRGLVIWDNDVKMICYEKFEIHYKCKFCGHMWTFLKARKQ